MLIDAQERSYYYSPVQGREALPGLPTKTM